MTGETRQALKELVDRGVREKLKATPRKQCPGCAGDMNAWTIGCGSCISRHRRRRVYAMKRLEAPAPVVKVRGVCVCGCSWDTFTANCETCRQRHKTRKLRAQAVRESVARRATKTEAVASSLRESATASDRKKVAA